VATPDDDRPVVEVTNVTVGDQFRVELWLHNRTNRDLFFFDPALSAISLDPRHCGIQITDQHAVLRRPMHFTPGFVVLKAGGKQVFQRELDRKEIGGWACRHIDVSAMLAFFDEERMRAFPPRADQEGLDFAIKNEALVKSATRRIELPEPNQR
jgi:hypothetical protein